MGIPANIVIIWSGAIIDIPEGWLLCNGQNGTPNLKNRFVVGSGSKYILEETGGSANSLNIAHTHSDATTSSAPNHVHANTVFIPANPNANANGTTFLSALGTSGNGSHAHSFNTTNAGQSGIGRNMPPYLALAYIMYGGD